MEYMEGFAGKPVCGVIAVAICAGVSFEVARARCRDAMPAHRQRFRGSTNHKQRVAALKALAVQFTEHDLKPMTLKSFIEKCAKPGVMYMVRVTGHVVTVKDGIVNDQSSSSHYTKRPRTSRKRATHYIEILGKGW